MSGEILFVFFLNFIISFIGTLAYAVRLVAVRTGKLSVTFALFNILMLVSRTAGTFQTPILTKYAEQAGAAGNLISLFQSIILISGFASIAAAFMVPTFQRMLYNAVLYFSEKRSLPKLLLKSVTKTGFDRMRSCTVAPVKENITKLNLKKLPINLLVFNLLTVALLTAGFVAPIYAMSLDPDLRATCVTLSSFITGFAAILLTIFIDPPLSIMTDDVMEGKRTEEEFRVCVIGMVGSKTIGTFAALLLLEPAAQFIAAIARIL